MVGWVGQGVHVSEAFPTDEGQPPHLGSSNFEGYSHSHSGPQLSMGATISPTHCCFLLFATFPSLWLCEIIFQINSLCL